MKTTIITLIRLSADVMVRLREVPARQRSALIRQVLQDNVVAKRHVYHTIFSPKRSLRADVEVLTLRLPIPQAKALRPLAQNHTLSFFTEDCMRRHFGMPEMRELPVPEKVKKTKKAAETNTNTNTNKEGE